MIFRNFFILFLLSTSFFLACRKDNSTSSPSDGNKQDNNNDNGKITAEYYITGKLNNESFTWQCKEGLLWRPGTKAVSSLWQGNVTSDLTAYIDADTNNPEWGITFKTYYVEFEDSKEDVFNNFIHTGPWEFSNTSEFHVGTKGLVVVYTDKQEKSYSSVGLQTESTANVVSVTRIPDPYRIYNNLKIKITLNCTLYPEDGKGNTLKLTDAEAVLHLQNLL